MSTPLTPRRHLAVANVTVELDGTRNFWVLISTRTSGVLLKHISAGESHQPLLPYLESAHLQLPKSYHHYSLVWGAGAGANPTTYTLRHDRREEGVTNDHLVATDYLALWGDDDGPDFLDHNGAPVSTDDVDLIGVYPNVLSGDLD